MKCSSSYYSSSKYSVKLSNIPNEFDLLISFLYRYGKTSAPDGSMKFFVSERFNHRFFFLFRTPHYFVVVVKKRNKKKIALKKKVLVLSNRGRGNMIVKKKKKNKKNESDKTNSQQSIFIWYTTSWLYVYIMYCVCWTVCMFNKYILFHLAMYMI